MTYERRRRQLKTRLVEQIGYIESSSEQFDAGWTAEANRLAVAVRVLVHDTTQSKSLYKQMGLKDRLQWITADPDGAGPNTPYKFCLVLGRMTRVDDGWQQQILPVPREDILTPPIGGTLISFSPWWQTPVMIANGVRIARSDIVGMLANQDGGAHVDLTKERFKRLLAAVPNIAAGVGASGEPQMMFGVSVDEDTARQVLRAAMRTIADEVWLGFHNQLDIIDPENEIQRVALG